MSESKGATPEEVAKLDFEPWQHDPDAWQPPSNSEWGKLANPHLIATRIAWHLHFKTKDELIDMLDDHEEDLPLTEMVDQIAATANWFRAFTMILDGARARMTIAIANKVAGEESGS